VKYNNCINLQQTVINRIYSAELQFTYRSANAQ